MTVAIVTPPTHLRIDKLWAYISRDERGNEGLCAATMPNGMLLPLIAADQARLESLTPIAEALAKHAKFSIHLVEFTGRTELRTIEGKSS